MLRPVTALDLTALVVHWTQPDVRRFLFDDAVMSTDEVSAVIAESNRDFASAGYGFWVIQTLARGGGCGTLPDGGGALPRGALPRGGGGALAGGTLPDGGGALPRGALPDGGGGALAGGTLPDGGGVLAGTIGLRLLDDLGPEIVYSLAPGMWGKGYATEAAGAVVDYALRTLGLPQVLAEVDNGNTASAAVIKRIGLTPFDEVPGLLGPMTRYRKIR